jgi:cell fate (sporulation/competence/biofilm development) regulator YmcA (YheA/YmcA/DUF963 family)
VKSLNKLSELVSLIKEDDHIIRFKELEDIIDHNKSIGQDYNKLLELQKTMVNKEYRKDKNYTLSKEKYEAQLQIVKDYPILEEYLDLLDEINSDLAMIKSIIEQEISKDFD